MTPKTLIIGGGLTGVTTLYELAARGAPATLLEANDDLALGASFANGGMVTPSEADPWNGPGVMGHLAASLFQPGAAMKLRLHAIPGLTAWGLRFLANSAPSRHLRSTRSNFALAEYSASRILALRDELGLAYDQGGPGTVKIFQTEAAMARPLMLARDLAERGLRYARLGADEVVALEPQLAPVKHLIAGGLHYPDDHSGDARRFTLALAAKAVERGGVIRTGVRVQRLLMAGGTVRGVETTAGETLEGRVVLAAGIDAPALARPAGLSLPIKPAKGYSLTLDATPLGADAPRIPVVDDAMHAAVVPLGSRLRLVGTAEFTGRDATIRPERIDNLVRMLRRLYPDLVGRLDLAAAQPWAGLRPMGVDGVPFVGPAPAPGLWLTCGHGHLGWTMAAGSAAVLADLMEGRAPAIDPAPYAYAR